MSESGEPNRTTSGFGWAETGGMFLGFLTGFLLNGALDDTLSWWPRLAVSIGAVLLVMAAYSAVLVIVRRRRLS